ncbi:hypothetical protein [Nonomuraea sp. NPDC049028]|uniref:hypothetical protein n=1 Tax=Nonomuraea sp. NPDC049028 TaxID=3364348 RepID=UPI0037127C30
MRRTWTALAAALALVGGLATAPAQAAAVSVKVGRVTVSPARYAGACPATTTFSARVAVRGASRVTYRWLRGDGHKGAVVTATVKAGAVVVRDRQSFAKSTSGWQALQVLSPRKTTSAKARFTVSCADASPVVVTVHTPEPPRVTASVTTPAPYSGSCGLPGHRVTFDGRIKASRTPASVAYRWVDSDGGPEPVERLWLTSAGKAVSSSRTFLTSHSGYHWLEILDDKGHVTGRSDKSAYRVTCTRPEQRPLASVTDARVTPVQYEGPCNKPLDFVFRADLAVTQPTEVIYQWERSDGTKIPGQVVLSRDLTTTLEHTWKVTDLVNISQGSARLRVLTPNAVATDSVPFRIICRIDEAVTITGTEITPDSNPTPCPSQSKPFTIRSQVAPKPATKLPLTISYRWRWADGSMTSPYTYTFVQAAPVTLERWWDEWISKSGSVRLEVTANDRVYVSPSVAYEVICDGKPPTGTYPRVVSITEASITPADYRGKCPVTLKAQGKVTVSAPMDALFTQWVFDGKTQPFLGSTDFPANGPLAKVVEREFTVEESTGKPVTAYMESRVPNVMSSDKMTYTVTCT